MDQAQAHTRTHSHTYEALFWRSQEVMRVFSLISTKKKTTKRTMTQHQKFQILNATCLHHIGDSQTIPLSCTSLRLSFSTLKTDPWNTKWLTLPRNEKEDLHQSCIYRRGVALSSLPLHRALLVVAVHPALYVIMLVIFEKNSSPDILFPTPWTCRLCLARRWAMISRAEVETASQIQRFFFLRWLHLTVSGSLMAARTHAACVFTFGRADAYMHYRREGLKARWDNARFSSASSLLILTPSMPFPSHCCLSSQT